MTHQGYGFCEFLTEEDAEYACKIMNQIKLWGKPIRVNKVRRFLSVRMYAGRRGPGASTIQHVALSRAVRPIMSILHCRVRTICSNGSIVGTPSYAMLCERSFHGSIAIDKTVAFVAHVATCSACAVVSNALLMFRRSLCSFIRLALRDAPPF